VIVVTPAWQVPRWAVAWSLWRGRAGPAMLDS